MFCIKCDDLGFIVTTKPDGTREGRACVETPHAPPARRPRASPKSGDQILLALAGTKKR